MIHSILPVQFMCLTVFLHSLSSRPLSSTSWSDTLHFILHTFLHPIIVIFSQHMPIPSQHAYFKSSKNRENKSDAANTNTHTQSTMLRLSGLCPGQPGWAGTRRNIHPLTPIVVINHPLSASSIYHNPWHPLCSIYMPALYPQSLSTFSLVYLLAWHPPFHTAFISSSNHYLLFAAHAHTIATCFAVGPRLCHLILVSLSILYLELYLVA